LSKELLRQVGEFMFGAEWQAPLAREIGVGERSMRRWAAGTDSVPAGVWSDIFFRLESRHGNLEYLMAEVKEASGLVEVHSFEVWDLSAGIMFQQTGKSTRERIAKVGGNILTGTAEWVPSSSVDSEGRLIRTSRMGEKYRLGEIQSMMDSRRDFDGSGFNISNEHGAPIATFGYAVETDAAKARKLVKKAIADAALIVGHEPPP
jgi:hypothetical protein